ncbi:MAG TPA: PASTA domain-containing protein, partial [Acidimicrobiia bacterium]|nr:PASTA domain-containing protein [Acidimicrobiia bacterium]
DSKTFTVKVKLPSDSAAGKLTALAVASGVCPAMPLPTTDMPGPVPGSGPRAISPDDIPVTGQASVDGPKVGVCIVPDLKGLEPTQARTILEAAGCTLGTVTDGGPGNPADLGKIVDQGPKADTPVALGTPVDITVGGPLCTVPSLAGLTPDQAKTRLEDAGCKLGTVTTGPTGNPQDAGKITTQNPPAAEKVKPATTVDVVIFPAAAQSAAGPSCTVPDLSGLSEPDARTKVEAAGCVLVTEQRATTKFDEVGKVLDQSPAATMVVAKGSPVNATFGVAVAGQMVTRQNSDASDTTPTLARTGGVALGGLALWLVVSGLLTQLAGSRRLWRLTRRRQG